MSSLASLSASCEPTPLRRVTGSWSRGWVGMVVSCRLPWRWAFGRRGTRQSFRLLEARELGFEDRLTEGIHRPVAGEAGAPGEGRGAARHRLGEVPGHQVLPQVLRSEEHTSELQSRENLVCRLLL